MLSFYTLKSKHKLTSIWHQFFLLKIENSHDVNTRSLQTLVESRIGSCELTFIGVTFLARGPLSWSIINFNKTNHLLIIAEANHICRLLTSTIFHHFRIVCSSQNLSNALHIEDLYIL